MIDVKGTMPAWAILDVLDVCAKLGMKDAPRVNWRISRPRNRWLLVSREEYDLANRGGRRVGESKGGHLFVWGYGTERLTSGRTFGSHTARPQGKAWDITITAGTDVWDQRLVLLHELAHFYGRPREHHSAAFWRRCFALYALMGIDMDRALAREKDYRKKAIAAHAYVVAAKGRR